MAKGKDKDVRVTAILEFGMEQLCSKKRY
uniref:Ribosomal protein L33 n=1 Tax=Psychotria kirkii TaxID=43559 RepID=A0A6F8F0M5_9GENT|nr:ribosomal protein L33 [Psychotria kirkii]